MNASADRAKRRQGRPDVELAEYLGMVKRILRAAGRRAGDGDEVDLTDLVQLREHMETAIASAVAGQRAAGASWSRIGAGLGVTRQSAHERYGGKL